MSIGYYKICPKCYRKYGRHFNWCLDCTPRAEPEKDGRYGRDTYKTRYGTIRSRDRVDLHFCCSRDLNLEKRLVVCETCKGRFKCFTQDDDTGNNENVWNL